MQPILIALFPALLSSGLENATEPLFVSLALETGQPPAEQSPPVPLDPPKAKPLSTGMKAVRVAEAAGNFVVANFFSTAIHETLHWGVLKATGTETQGINFIPLQQQARVSNKTFREMSDGARFAVAIAPQIWDPLSGGLPTWIHRPSDDSWWLRFSAMYYLHNVMFQGPAVITMTWLELANGAQAQKDIGVAAWSLTDNRAGQTAFCAGVTGLLVANIVLRRERVGQAWRIVTLQSSTWDLPTGSESGAWLPSFGVEPLRDGAAFRLSGLF